MFYRNKMSIVHTLLMILATAGETVVLLLSLGFIGVSLTLPVTILSAKHQLKVRMIDAS